MEDIIDEYGGAILAMLGAVVILGFVGALFLHNTNIIEIIKSYINNNAGYPI